MQQPNNIKTCTPIAAAGTFVQEIRATFDPSFFALVSQHLYSSPNKAFEELVTNSWDADANNVYVQIPQNLHGPKAAIAILDDGSSMNIEGFEQLWSIANSSKRREQVGGRKKIGKFGIGKLATYLLCNELTYVCKAKDGVIRAVTMDYRKIDSDFNRRESSLELSVRVISDADLATVLFQYDGGQQIFDLIKTDIPDIQPTEEYFNEYGGEEIIPTKSENTWTLALLTSLKEQGRNIEVGRTRWMLSTALPLGSSMKIKYNDLQIIPSKSDVPITDQWAVGPELPFTEFEVEKGELISFKRDSNPYPRVVIPGLGEVTGTVTLYAESIAGGKSNNMESSNGCFVNVLGRVINTNGAGQFSVGSSGQGTYFKFRATVRVDSLDAIMTIQRDTLTESNPLRLLKAFLHRAFNFARQLDENAQNTLMASSSKTRKGSLNALPLSNLGAQMKASIDDITSLPVFVGDPGAIDLQRISQWLEDTEEGRYNAIEGLEMAAAEPSQPISSYDLNKRKIIINKNHPFVLEHSGTIEQRAVLEDMVVVNVLIDSYLYANGVDPKLIKDMATYRDISQRSVAQLRRNSPIQIINLLEEWKDQAKPLEEITGDALLYLGFSVERLAQSGQPEGIAEAFLSPQKEGEERGYRFTYDAKSTQKKRVSTGNVRISGLARHRKQHGADYSLVVAPDFQHGALSIEAEASQVTPITTNALGRLVSLTLNYGPINLVDLKHVFQYHRPEDVDQWVSDMESTLKLHKQIQLSTLIKAMAVARRGGSLDILSASVVAHNYQHITNDVSWPLKSHIIQVVKSLSMIAPRVISVDPQDNDRIFLLAPPDQIINELKRQIGSVPDALKSGIIKCIEEI
ncbi:MAG: hypothetical protein BGO55_20645 [Sphingobacteriales bacterium 50-39]|nr:ATP-binding protein [Sphingobacteriales bacterium]OJW59098.1 MAG: hypothetical protein BGO55_20645 [Sphingobacteriales bacterium 50-39]